MKSTTTATLYLITLIILFSCFVSSVQGNGDADDAAAKAEKDFLNVFRLEGISDNIKERIDMMKNTELLKICRSFLPPDSETLAHKMILHRKNILYTVSFFHHPIPDINAFRIPVFKCSTYEFVMYTNEWERQTVFYVTFGHDNETIFKLVRVNPPRSDDDGNFSDDSEYIPASLYVESKHSLANI